MKNLRMAVALCATIALPAQAAPQRGHEDYPLEALRKHQQGAVLVDLIPGADGRFTHCSIVVRSGSPQLNDATCKIYMTRAAFTPALDANGKAILRHALGRIDWVIPNCKAAPLTDPRLIEGPRPALTVTSLQGC